MIPKTQSFALKILTHVKISCLTVKNKDILIQKYLSIKTF